jgi:hypothetical protein
MALDRTSGYDMLVQVSETEINNQIATSFLVGGIFPTAMTVPINTGGISATADINFITPIADLDRPRPRMGLTVPFSNSQLRITAPLALTIAPLGGTITIVDSIQIVSSGGNQTARVDFNAGAPDVSVVFDAGSAALLAPLLAAAGINIDQAQNMVAGVVLNELQTNLRNIDLTPPIPVTNDADATTVFDIDVTTINDTSVADRDCIAFGVRMSSETGGNINNVTSNFIPSGSQSLVMMSNFWLLARAMRPRIAAALSTAVTNFDTPLRLNRSIPAPGGEGTLTNLDATVVGNRIHVTGRATDSGTGWSAESNFSFFIDIGLSGGSITVTATTPSVDTDVDVEWWVWLLSLGLGGLFGGIIGAIVGVIIVAIVEAVAESIADGMISDGISGALGGIPAIPLGPIGGGLSMTSVILDDLELRSSIIHSVSVPVKNRGSRTMTTGFAVDLDSGTVAHSAQAGSDLIWNPLSGLQTSGPSGLTITGTSYGALTPVKISRFPLATTQVPNAMIPMTLPPVEPFLPHDEIVFGMRTSEGRLARCRAWRSALQYGALHLDWVTYDTPTPSLDIAHRWGILEIGEVREYITQNCAYCRSSPVSRCGVFEAWPRLAAFPVDLQWCLCGTVLAEETGEVETKHGPLAYRVDGRRLYIETDMGQAVNCELCVSSIDARGMELFTCIKVSMPGTETNCRQCDPNKKPVSLEFIGIASELNSWRPLLAAAAVTDAENTAQAKARVSARE